MVCSGICRSMINRKLFTASAHLETYIYSAFLECKALKGQLNWFSMMKYKKAVNFTNYIQVEMHF